MASSGDRQCSCRCSAQWLFARWTLIFSTWCIPVPFLVFGSPSEEAVDWHELAMEEVDKERNSCKRPRAALTGGSAAAAATAAAWRSCRVARAAAGGKDRHSKVVTARGLRDRRVRLSVPTAIQFYDIQDRLGVDQPSKAIEWLIRAAATAIDALPSLDCSFILPSSAAADGTDNADDAEASTSETSKSSVLSLANAPDNANATAHQANAYNANASAGIGSQSQAHGTFAELLNCSTTDKPMQQPTLAYYAPQSSHIAPMSIEMMPQLAFSQEPHLPVAFDRGTLQSNAATAALWSPSHHQYLMQRFAAPADAPSLPFFLGGSSAAAPAKANAERRLQLWDLKGEGKR